MNSLNELINTFLVRYLFPFSDFNASDVWKCGIRYTVQLPNLHNRSIKSSSVTPKCLAFYFRRYVHKNNSRRDEYSYAIRQAIRYSISNLKDTFNWYKNDKLSVCLTSLFSSFSQICKRNGTMLNITDSHYSVREHFHIQKKASFNI